MITLLIIILSITYTIIGYEICLEFGERIDDSFLDQPFHIRMMFIIMWPVALHFMIYELYKKKKEDKELN